jgi:hypothetical protein
LARLAKQKNLSDRGRLVALVEGVMFTAKRVAGRSSSSEAESDCWYPLFPGPLLQDTPQGMAAEHCWQASNGTRRIAWSVVWGENPVRK